MGCGRSKQIKPITPPQSLPVQELPDTSKSVVPSDAEVKPVSEVPLRNTATSSTRRQQRSSGTLQSPAPLNTPLDMTSLHQIISDLNFSSIVKAPIAFTTDTTPPSLKGKPSSSLCHQKERQEKEWKEKYYIHGVSADIVADVKSETHGCIDSSVSDDIDSIKQLLQAINTEADRIFKERSGDMSSKEQQSIDRCITERENLISILLKQGHSYADRCEDYYQKSIENFIKKLEYEMSEYLDQMQKQIAAEKERIITGANTTIALITDRADKAKKDLYDIVQQGAGNERKRIMEIMKLKIHDMANQPLGYEQSRKIEIQMYSTVGNKKDGQGCDNIPGRKTFIQDINSVKPQQPTIRTVYLGSEATSKN